MVRSRADYINAGLEHLTDTNTYLELDKDYTQHVAKIIRQSLQQLKTQGLISPRMAEYSLPSRALRMAQIYFLKNTQIPNGHQTHSVHHQLTNSQSR